MEVYSAVSLPCYAQYLILIVTICTAISPRVYANFYNDIDVTWGDNNVRIFNNGEQLELSLTNYSGSGFQSKKEFLFGSIDISMKLVPDNSAGTVSNPWRLGLFAGESFSASFPAVESIRIEPSQPCPIIPPAQFRTHGGLDCLPANLSLLHFLQWNQ